mmetsp:Transcript_25711/g.60281  ORF Transcript_25711/g.60281 Transcript_25711/m.60281 type:complete len:202 (+) Transcript_25711:1841-2446(+)
MSSMTRKALCMDVATTSWTSKSRSRKTVGAVTVVASSFISESRVGIRSDSLFPMASEIVKKMASISSSSFSVAFSNRYFAWHCMRRMFQRSINKEMECSVSVSGEVVNMSRLSWVLLLRLLWLDERRFWLLRRLAWLALLFRLAASSGSLSRNSSISRSWSATDIRFRFILTSETRVWSPSTQQESVCAMFCRVRSSVESR